MSRLVPLSFVGSTALVGILSLCLSRPVAADEKNPAVVACEGKAEGAACTFQRLIKNNEGQPDQRPTPGQCKPDECCALDYSKGSPPQTVCGACLACKESTSGPRPTPDAPEVTADGGATPAGPGGEAPRTSSDPPANAPNDKRGCSVDTAPARRSWAGLLWLPLCLRRRRR